MFDPYSLTGLPREIIGQICLQLSLPQLVELCAVDKLRTRLREVITVVSDDLSTTFHPDSPYAAFYGFPNVSLTGKVTSAIALVDIADVEQLRMPHFREELLRSGTKHFINFSGRVSAVWAGGIAEALKRKVTLNKLLRLCSHKNVVMLLPRGLTRLELRNTVLSDLIFFSFSPLVTVKLECVTVVGTQDPFEQLSVEHFNLKMVAQDTLDVVHFENATALTVTSRMIDSHSGVDWDEYQFFLGSRLSNINSTTLEDISITGLALLENWDIPSLKTLTLNMTPFTEELYSFPSLRHINLQGLEVLDVHSGISAHKASNLFVNSACKSTFTLSNKALKEKDKFLLSTDDLTKLLPVSHLNLPVGTAVRASSPAIFQKLLTLNVVTDTRDDQKVIFLHPYDRLEKLFWKVAGGPEIASIAHFKSPCLSLKELQVDVDQRVRLHLDLHYISNNFPNIKSLVLNNSYYNKKLITQRDESRTLNFHRLETISLKNFPEEVLPVFQHFDAPRLRDITIVCMSNNILLQRTSVEFRLHSQSYVENISIKTACSLMRGFDNLSRHIHFVSHHRLTNLHVEMYNTIGITDCQNLKEISINNERAPLRRLVGDCLPHLRKLSYGILDISQSCTAHRLDELSTHDRQRIQDVERFEKWIYGGVVRELWAVDPSKVTQPVPVPVPVAAPSASPVPSGAQLAPQKPVIIEIKDRTESPVPVTESRARNGNAYANGSISFNTNTNSNNNINMNGTNGSPASTPASLSYTNPVLEPSPQKPPAPQYNLPTAPQAHSEDLFPHHNFSESPRSPPRQPAGLTATNETLIQSLLNQYKPPPSAASSSLPAHHRSTSLLGRISKPPVAPRGPGTNGSKSTSTTNRPHDVYYPRRQ